MVKGLISVLIIWITVFVIVYLYFETRLDSKVVVANASLEHGEVLIPRSRDGHYYVQGAINGYPVKFLVDTGASVVSISKEIAQRANLPTGRSANFTTAAGIIKGEMVYDQTIDVGGIIVGGLQVSVGLHGDVALLGQNFLRKIDVIQTNDRMILRVRAE